MKGGRQLWARARRLFKWVNERRAMFGTGNFDIVVLVGIGQHNITLEFLFGAFVDRLLRSGKNHGVAAVCFPSASAIEEKFGRPILEEDDHALSLSPKAIQDVTPATASAEDEISFCGILTRQCSHR